MIDLRDPLNRKKVKELQDELEFVCMQLDAAKSNIKKLNNRVVDLEDRLHGEVLKSVVKLKSRDII